MWKYMENKKDIIRDKITSTKLRKCNINLHQSNCPNVSQNITCVHGVCVCVWPLFSLPWSLPNLNHLVSFNQSDSQLTGLLWCVFVCVCYHFYSNNQTQLLRKEPAPGKRVDTMSDSHAHTHARTHKHYWLSIFCSISNSSSKMLHALSRETEQSA